MNRVAIIGGLLLFSAQVNSAVTPQGSRYDSRMQTVSYNAANTTVITAGVGYLSTLLFDDEETVLDARPGMEKGGIFRRTQTGFIFVPFRSLSL